MLFRSFRAYKAQDFDGAIAAAKKVLALNYLDIDAHIVCDLSYRMASNAIAAEPYHQMAIRLLGSIYQSGDGASPETAYQIIAVREEYAVLNTLGLAPTNHRQLVQDTHRFDVFDATDKSSGEIKTIYFNVDRPLAWLEKHPPAPAKD